MQYALVAGEALFVSALTLFSGFGLGKLLMPAFALFLPVPVAVSATAVVHFANNLFKLVLVGRKADWTVVVRFGLPAAAAAIVGAMLLGLLADVPPLLSYSLGGETRVVTPVKLTVAVLMMGFALFELLPRLRRLSFERRYRLVGGSPIPRSSSSSAASGWTCAPGSCGRSTRATSIRCAIAAIRCASIWWWRWWPTTGSGPFSRRRASRITATSPGSGPWPAGWA